MAIAARDRTPHSASRYYSLPHLAVSGTVSRDGRTEPVTGTAWLDREWSSSYLPPGAIGWDWTGLNFTDGGALMAFRIRRADGSTLWAGGTWRTADGDLTVLGPRDVAFEPRQRWRSPRTGALYPIDPVLRIRLPGAIRTLPLHPLFLDQELDTRAAGTPGLLGRRCHHVWWTRLSRIDRLCERSAHVSRRLSDASRRPKHGVIAGA